MRLKMFGIKFKMPTFWRFTWLAIFSITIWILLELFFKDNQKDAGALLLMVFWGALAADLGLNQSMRGIFLLIVVSMLLSFSYHFMWNLAS